jgi:hypothetical protein
MNTYKVTYEVFYTILPKSPRVREMTFKAKKDSEAEDIARSRITLLLRANQAGKLLTLSRLETHEL